MNVAYRPCHRWQPLSHVCNVRRRRWRPQLFDWEKHAPEVAG